MINCKICNKELNSIFLHLSKHKIDINSYKEMYPGAPLMSEENKLKVSEATKKAMNTDEMLEKMKLARKKIDYTKIKPKYDRSDPKIKEKQYSEERNKKISEARKKYWETRKGKTVEELYGEDKGKRIRKIKSEQTKGKNNPSYGKIYNNTGRIRGHYKNIFFRSLWEYSFLKYLENCNIELTDVEYEKICIKFNIDGVERTYRPDFYLKKQNKLIEIKSKWHLEQDKHLINHKKIAAEQWCKNNNSTFYIMTEDDFPVLNINILKNDINVTLLDT